MATFKTRIEQLEEENYRQLMSSLDGRSCADVDFFCIHGYLPEVPIPGEPFKAFDDDWDEQWKRHQESTRALAHKTEAEKENFCRTGVWPDGATE